MRILGSLAVAIICLVSVGTPGFAHDADHDHAADSSGGGKQTLTGEVVDVFCYLSHHEKGLGPDHAGCAKKCIESGMPVAIKVGDQLYLAVMASHDPANKTLAAWAGKRVTVQGPVMEKDGQHVIAVVSVQPAN